MIVTVTLNAAVDVTYALDHVVWHGTNRVQGVQQRAGGKGINVARVLKELGHDVTAAGFAGGSTGEFLRADLATAGIADALVSIAGESRRTLAVVADGDATLFNEPGSRIAAREWDRLRTGLGSLLTAADAIALCGSLPLGVPDDAYAQLATAAADAGVPVVLDSYGTALLHGLHGRPAVVTPNADELARATGGFDVASAAESLRTAGADAVVVTLGPEGMVAFTSSGYFRAIPPKRVEGNPTGAGDAAVAALLVGLATAQPWEERLAHAVALSAASVLSPIAGSVDGEAYQRFVDQVAVERI